MSGRSPPASKTLNLFSSASTYSILTPTLSAIACATALSGYVFHFVPDSMTSSRSVTTSSEPPLADALAEAEAEAVSEAPCELAPFVGEALLPEQAASSSESASRTGAADFANPFIFIVFSPPTIVCIIIGSGRAARPDSRAG
ncbi:hypothetical protein [Cohnella massiliensis]|uniref:hypothetical protein n=1 Tax=Cohnella massiliensis TaxID=1816691 RepID=UPI001FE25F90|nr:hypothetical protein [Cohnella massiliensis]